MNDYIITEDGNCVGKYRQHTAPDVPSDLTVAKLSDTEQLSDYNVDWDDRLS